VPRHYDEGPTRARPVTHRSSTARSGYLVRRAEMTSWARSSPTTERVSTTAITGAERATPATARTASAPVSATSTQASGGRPTATADNGVAARAVGGTAARAAGSTYPTGLPSDASSTTSPRM